MLFPSPLPSPLDWSKYLSGPLHLVFSEDFEQHAITHRVSLLFPRFPMEASCHLYLLACVCLFITPPHMTYIKSCVPSSCVFPIDSTSCASRHSLRYRVFCSAGRGNAACSHLRNARSLQEDDMITDRKLGVPMTCGDTAETLGGVRQACRPPNKTSNTRRFETSPLHRPGLGLLLADSLFSSSITGRTDRRPHC